MASKLQQSQRRKDALSKERIVRTAIEILDSEGEDALTFRALTARLATGSGAIYWHVANKGELLAAATNDIVSHGMAEVREGAPAWEALRSIALNMFDAIDEHPWVGTQLLRAPSQLAMARIFESIGQQLQALGVSEAALFDAASVLVNYILGVAGQNAANAREHAQVTDRTAFLGNIAAQRAQLDAAQFPFMHRVAAQLPVHNDRQQFLFGIELIVKGILT